VRARLLGKRQKALHVNKARLFAWKVSVLNPEIGEDQNPYRSSPGLSRLS